MPDLDRTRQADDHAESGILLFRLCGVPVYAGDLAICVQGVGMFPFSTVREEQVGIVTDFRYDEDAGEHFVYFLTEGSIVRVRRSDITQLL